jgi:hypothetical protein
MLLTVDSAKSHTKMRNALFYLLLAASTALPALSAHGNWLGIENRTGVDLRLVAVGLRTDKPRPLTTVLLPDVLHDSTTAWIKLDDSISWMITGFAAFAPGGVREYTLPPERRRADVDRIATVNVRKMWTLCTLMESGDFEVAASDHYAGSDLRVAASEVNLDLAFLQRDFRAFTPRYSATEEKSAFEKLRAEFPAIMVPKGFASKDGEVARCYIEAWRNGWFSAVLGPFDESLLNLQSLYGLIVPYKGLSEARHAELGKATDSGFASGRSAGLELCKRAIEQSPK